MAKSAVVTINKVTPTLLYSGDGFITFQTASFLIGGADLTQENGFFASSLIMGFRILSDDKIYGLVRTDDISDTIDVSVFSCR